MKNTLAQKLFTSIREAKEKLSKFSPEQKSSLEKSWDIEHAYYSSALEGSKISRKEFEKFAEKVA